jgi:hypothetical protein
MAKPAEFMSKRELVAEGARLGLGSRSALDAKLIGQLRALVKAAQAKA